MNKNILILAGPNRNDVWNLNTPRHMIKVNGEPIIHRSQRILNDLGCEVSVVCDESVKDSYIVSHNTFLQSIISNNPKESIIWTYRTYLKQDCTNVILYGDCHYSEKLLQDISKEDGGDWKFYARSNPPESFAWVFGTQQYNLILKYAPHIETLLKKKKLDTYWADYLLYRIMANLPMGSKNEHILDVAKIKEDYYWVEHSDGGFDFDYPEEYLKFLNGGDVISHALSSDIDTVIDILFLYKDFWFTNITTEYIKDKINNNNVILMNGVVIVYTVNNDNSVRINCFANKFQGNGMSEKVLNLFFKQFKGKRIWLTTDPLNKRACRFYLKCNMNYCGHVFLEKQKKKLFEYYG